MPYKDPEKNRESKRKWAKNNPEYTKKYAAEYRKKNKKKAKEYASLWYQNNKNRVYLTCAGWRKENPEKCKATNLKRRASKLKSVGSFTGEEWKTLCKLWKCRCLCCGKHKKLTADHI